MIHQPLPNKMGGTIGAVDYMCNERISEGTARILKGNPELTKSIVKSITFKEKLLVGVLSFEETNIKEEYKIEIMNTFEYTLLPGMKSRYNILWVEHTDKGRLELNYLIPKIDLISKMSLTPYFDRFDRYRIELWRDQQNHQYNLSDPRDPAKRQVLANDKRINLIEDYKQLNKLLHALVSNNTIKSRRHMLIYLNANNIEAEGFKNHITVKLANSKNKQKFHTGIYNEEFRSIDSITRIINK
ncbi:relaxase/mobilization nuclease domain-containing protein [Poseidonibacter ostreae]|uniref:relaxase/mobilization nuclease domain-containing protein n=1 Tax=Poseidonibacter ostreae TaxID=2654171 RepID=UPI001264483F|nr:relaxase/mobilization nuclease domain-containing protein [Poseidonibacter ostreae]KAB7886414.1 relaxase/mobilization nuclease domain-containing protein [Poseidonibacter ostreae]